jgi:hypothetical protein
MKLGPALSHLYDTETDLADDLAAIAERHASDQDVYHQGRLMAERSLGLAKMLAPFLEQYEQRTDDSDGDSGWASFTEKLHRGMAQLTGREAHVAGPLLLRDLRDLEVASHACLTDWVIVHQGAMAARDKGLVDLCKLGQDETRRVERWLTTRIKESAPQVLMG